MNEIAFTDTMKAQAAGESIMGDNYHSIITELENARTEISLNWEGDTTDINDIITRIDTVINEFKNKIGPAVTQLGKGVYNFSIAVNQVASADVETGAATGTDVNGEGTATSGDSSKPGFWSYHGQDFANDWDYSGCDGLLDYVGATVSGLCGTVGSTVNFVVDGASELVGWIFG